METYEALEIEVIEFEAEDVITESQGIDTPLDELNTNP